ncbi:MAG: hypothetical protein GXP31_17135 [Kiritimatiellaeota bacterium]|nr:hypothetical protein [Kiritimatiellota bacterium]
MAPETFQWAEWKRRIPALLLLFPLIALGVGGLAAGTDSFVQAKEYERAAQGTMAGYDGFTREDMDTLKARAMRHAVAAFLLCPFAAAGLTAVIGELAAADWARSLYVRAGLLGISIGAVQVLLLWGQIGTMWLLGAFVGLFGAGLTVRSCWVKNDDTSATR